MNIYRIALIVLVIFSSFFLTGFKKPPKKPQLHHKAVKTSANTQPKALNLDIPLKANAISGDSDVGKPSDKTDTSSALFDAGKTQRNQPLGLRGQVILSQEPEAGKLKSADGAGIVFDFHP